MIRVLNSDPRCKQHLDCRIRHLYGVKRICIWCINASRDEADANFQDLIRKRDVMASNLPHGKTRSMHSGTSE